MEDDPLTTRTTTALAYTIFALGLTVGAAGILPEVDSAGRTSRCGAWIAIASLPLWVSRAVHRACETNEQMISHAHKAGYQLAMRHVEDSAAGGGALTPRIPAPGGLPPVHAQRRDQ